MRVLANVLAAAGLLALGYWAFEFVTARFFQARETRRFVSERQATPSPLVTAPEPSELPEPHKPPAKRLYPGAGNPIAMLVIPRLGVSTIVVEGAKERELKLAPGHIQGTPLPGEGGNVGVAGHRDTFFRPLRRIHQDDAIHVVMLEKEYQYKVTSTEIVGPRDVQVLYPRGREMLTLVTCYPFDFVGSAPKRFVVHADCVNCPK